ncbi:MAG: membrane or secreted protein [Planctomycetota bacterium]
MRQRTMMRRVSLWCSLVLPLTVGCGFFRPKGPMNQQQATAVVHDPFPQLDIGPHDPTARPPGYEKPLPEAERNRIIADTFPQLVPR